MSNHDEAGLEGLSLEGVTLRYGRKTAVDHVSLRVRAGSFTGIVGRSGAGKSTLLRMINGLVQPTAGQIRWRGQAVSGLRGAARRRWHARCAMVFQQFNLAGRLDVLTNTLCGRLNHVPLHRSLLGLWSHEDRLMAFAALERFDIADLASQRAGQLSGGQQQRVAIARALMQEPEVILADEPIASLDPRNTRVVMDTLARINRDDGITVVCNLHSLEIARRYCDRLIGLSAGRVVFDGPAHDLGEDAARALYGMETEEAAAPPAEPAEQGRTRTMSVHYADA